MHEVERHYTRGQLERSILEALQTAGKDLERLSLDDLAPIDEFHIRGREATKLKNWRRPPVWMRKGSSSILAVVSADPRGDWLRNMVVE
jgi:hypothetical protein